MLTHARQNKAGRVPARLGRVVSTHRASERVRGSGRGSARRGVARQGPARRSKHTAAYGPLQFAWPGTARHGEARRGQARRGKHTAAYGPLQFARRGQVGHGQAKQSRARLGRDLQTHSGPRAVAVCSEQPGTAARCWALPGRAKSSLVNTQRLTGRCSLRGSARQGAARQGKAQQTHSGLRAVAVWRGFARLGVAGQGGAGRGPANTSG